MKTAIFLCDKTGVMARPWANAGHTCYCVDVQHSIRRDRIEAVGNGKIIYAWGDARSWTPPVSNIAFMAAFPPCTHLSLSGARDFQKKRGFMLADALQIFDSCKLACVYSGAKYMLENPKSRLSTHRESPTYKFHPWEYAGYLLDPEAENTTKETWLWTGGAS